MSAMFYADDDTYAEYAEERNMQLEALGVRRPPDDLDDEDEPGEDDGSGS